MSQEGFIMFTGPSYNPMLSKKAALPDVFWNLSEKQMLTITESYPEQIIKLIVTLDLFNELPLEVRAVLDRYYKTYIKTLPYNSQYIKTLLSSVKEINKELWNGLPFSLGEEIAIKVLKKKFSLIQHIPQEYMGIDFIVQFIKTGLKTKNYKIVSLKNGDQDIQYSYEEKVPLHLFSSNMAYELIKEVINGFYYIPNKYLTSDIIYQSIKTHFIYRDELVHRLPKKMVDRKIVRYLLAEINDIQIIKELLSKTSEEDLIYLANNKDILENLLNRFNVNILTFLPFEHLPENIINLYVTTDINNIERVPRNKITQGMISNYLIKFNSKDAVNKVLPLIKQSELFNLVLNTAPFSIGYLPDDLLSEEVLLSTIIKNPEAIKSLSDKYLNNDNFIIKLANNSNKSDSINLSILSDERFTRVVQAIIAAYTTPISPFILQNFKETFNKIDNKDWAKKIMYLALSHHNIKRLSKYIPFFKGSHHIDTEADFEKVESSSSEHLLKSLLFDVFNIREDSYKVMASNSLYTIESAKNHNVFKNFPFINIIYAPNLLAICITRIPMGNLNILSYNPLFSIRLKSESSVNILFRYLHRLEYLYKKGTNVVTESYLSNLFNEELDPKKKIETIGKNFKFLGGKLTLVKSYKSCIVFIGGKGLRLNNFRLTGDIDIDQDLIEIFTHEIKNAAK